MVLNQRATNNKSQPSVLPAQVLQETIRLIRARKELEGTPEAENNIDSARLASYYLIAATKALYEATKLYEEPQGLGEQNLHQRHSDLTPPEGFTIEASLPVQIVQFLITANRQEQKILLQELAPIILATQDNLYYLWKGRYSPGLYTYLEEHGRFTTAVQEMKKAWQHPALQASQTRLLRATHPEIDPTVIGRALSSALNLLPVLAYLILYTQKPFLYGFLDQESLQQFVEEFKPAYKKGADKETQRIARQRARLLLVHKALGLEDRQLIDANDKKILLQALPKLREMPGFTNDL